MNDTFGNSPYKRRRFTPHLLTLIILLACGRLAQADANQGAWFASWTASPQATWSEDFVLPTGVPSKIDNQTLRQVLRLSLGGDRVRVVLSNEHGIHPVRIGAAHVAVSDTASATVAATDKVVLFSGRRSAVIRPGAKLVSDPVDLDVGPREKLAVTLYLPEPTTTETFHWDARRTAYLATGNQVGQRQFDAAETFTARILLSGVLVEHPDASGVVAAFGDSITDGNGATIDADSRWPDFLAERLTSQGVAVINAGISGGRLLEDGMGVSALARFDRDVLAQPGIRSVIVLIGINDISWPGTAFHPTGRLPSLDALIAGYRQLVERAHVNGVTVFGGTLPPFEGALSGTPLSDYFQPAKDRLRRRLNNWIRESGTFDGVIDFARVLRAEEEPSRLAPAFDSGDHLHPGDRGNKAMADAIDLSELLDGNGGLD